MNIPVVLGRACMALVVLAALLAMAPAQAQIADLNGAINKAGRERMLSQRMAKAWLQLAQAVDPARSKRVLDNSIVSFERQLLELQNFAPTPEIRATYLELQRVWLDYRNALTMLSPTRESALRILHLSDETLALAHRATTQLEALSGTPAARLVNLSGRQRMLSQRMAKLFQADAWGATGPETAAELIDARHEFTVALAELQATPANTGRLRAELELVAQQWYFFESALTQQDLDPRTRAVNVATTSERILEAMESVVGLYEALP